MSIFLTNKTPIIDEDNWREQLGDGDGDGRRIVIDGEPMSFGCKPRVEAPGSIEVCARPDFDLIPRNEWSSRIKDIEAAQASLPHVFRRSGMRIKNQNGTNYCHANSPATVIEYNRAIQGEPYVEMSPGSIGGPITNFSNSGMWISADLKQCVRYGCASTEFVPPNQISKRGWKPGAEENALLHRTTHWYDMMSKSDGKMFDRCATMILQGRAVCVAYNWWSHAVTAVHLVEISSGKFGFLIQNSWGESYGDGGFAVLAEGRGTPDEAYTPIQATASLI